jgi:hypothetical protein
MSKTERVIILILLAILTLCVIDLSRDLRHLRKLYQDRTPIPSETNHELP